MNRRDFLKALCVAPAVPSVLMAKTPREVVTEKACPDFFSHENPFRIRRGWIIAPNFAISQAVMQPQFEDFLMMPDIYSTIEDFCYNKAMRMWRLKINGLKWEIQFKSETQRRAQFCGTSIDWIWFCRWPNNFQLFQECRTRLVGCDGDWWVSRKLPEKFLIRKTYAL